MALVLAASLLVAGGAAQAKTVYVDADATAPGDGTTWATAYTYLQDALENAESGDEIWVAGGTYGGATFNLVDGVGLYGGFAASETALTQRNWRVHETILTGEGSRQVVVASGLSDTARLGSTTVLDGFTVTGGNTSAYGGGMLNSYSNATIRNCTFESNYSSNHGGGMANRYSSPRVENCRFLANECPKGGGMNNHPSSNPTLVNVEFIGNVATDFGGGLNSWDNSHPKLVNVTFVGNSVTGGYGGGMSDHEGSTPKTTSVTNGIFWGNSASVEGTEQIASEKNGEYNFDRDVTYSLVQDGYPGEGNISDEPNFVKVPTSGDADWSTPGDNDYGDLTLRAVSPGIDAGSDDAISSYSITTDLAGNPRFDGTVDMGAYETVQTPSGTVTLDVSMAGAGSGTVTADGEGIYGARFYAENTVVTLEAIPNQGSFFEGWTGDVSGTERETTLTMDADKSCTARFGCAAPTAVIVTSADGSAVTLGGGGSYAPGLGDSIVSYRWLQTSGGVAVMLTGEDSAEATFTAPTPESGEELQLWFELVVTDNHGRTGKASCFVTVTSQGVTGNEPPTAVALNMTVPELTEAVLDGTGSSDDVAVVSYRWRQTSGPAVTLSDPASANPTFRAPADVGANGKVLWFELTVADGAGLTDVDTCIVNVTSGNPGSNQPPVADAGGTQTVFEGGSVTLDGAGSTDPEDSLASFQWIQVAGPEVILSAAGTGSLTFTAPAEVGAGGLALWFQLLVTDAGGLQASDTCAVNVISTSATGVNGVPRAEAFVSGVQKTAAGVRVTLSAADSSDPDGGELMYSWKLVSGSSAVAFSDPVAKVTSFTADGDAGVYVCRLTVTDGNGLVDTCECAVDIAEETANGTGSGENDDGGGGCRVGVVTPSLIAFLVSLSLLTLRR